MRFAANLSEDDKHEQEIEKYLTEVETSPDTSYSSQLKRKIVGAFESKLSYQLLTKAKFDYLQAKREYEDNSFIISLLDGLKLTNHQKETLENIVIAVYGFINISYETITVNKYSVSSDPNSNSDRV